MGWAVLRNDVVKFLDEWFSDWTLGVAGGAGLHTIPELLLIVKLVGDLEFHRSRSVSPAITHLGLEDDMEVRDCGYSIWQGQMKGAK